MLKFISFGSGSSGNCYCLYTGTDALLIDSGIGTRTLKKYLRQYGLQAQDFHHLLVTHDHADHVKSVGSVSQDWQLPVYATEKVHEGIDHNFCVRHKVPETLRHTIEKNKSLTLGEFTVTPFHVPHDSQDCVGYKIVAEGVTFCLMTDVGYVTDEMKNFISEANYLVIEANHDEEMVKAGPYPPFLKERILSHGGHLSNSACAQAIAENATPALRHVWLCHLSEENNHPELARKTVEAGLREYGIVAGTDFQLDVLRRQTPTGIFELT